MGYKVALLLVTQPASQPTAYLEKGNILAATDRILSKFETKDQEPNNTLQML
jgi:hypothetical protein